MGSPKLPQTTRTPYIGRLAAVVLLPLLGLGVAYLRPCSAQQEKIELSLPLVVLSPDGKIVSGLKPEDLAVKGVKATVKRLVLDDRPRRVALLLDISGSMKGGYTENSVAPWKNAKEMAKEFLVALPPTDWASLDVFATHDHEIVSYAHDMDSIRRAIDALPDPGSKIALQNYGDMTHWGNALSTILRAHTQPTSFGDCVVVFSDGESMMDESGVNYSRLGGQLLAKGIRVFFAVASTQLPLPPTLAIGIPADSLTWSASDPLYSSNAAISYNYYSLEGAVSFSMRTGGVAIQVEPLGPYDGRFKPDSLKAVMKEAASAVQDTYQVQLSLGEPLTTQRKIKVEVVGSNGKSRRDLTLLYPQYLEPLPTPPTNTPH